MRALRFLVFAALLSLAPIELFAAKPPMTLEGLQATKPFSSWEGHVNPRALDESRRIYKSTVSKLVQIGLGKSRGAYLPVLNRYIEEFNRIEDKYEFIETIEREDICENLSQILGLLKLQGVAKCDDLPAARNW
jgi:hypothetical protein